MPGGSDFFWEVLLHDYKILYFRKLLWKKKTIKIPDSYSALESNIAVSKLAATTCRCN